MVNRYLLSAALMALAFGQTARADVRIECSPQSPPVSCEIEVSGRIDEEDFESIYSVLGDRTDSVGVTLVLDSQGGDLHVAMRIGRLLADIEKFPNVNTLVPPGATCHSACPFIFAAGHIRINEGVLGLHRPFDTDPGRAGATLGDAAESAHRVSVEIADYLRLFGVSTCLAEAMMATPSDQIWELTTEELFRFGLGPRNVAIAELEKARALSRCGVEWYENSRRWEAVVMEQCAPPAASGCTEHVNAEIKKHTGFDYLNSAAACLR